MNKMEAREDALKLLRLVPKEPGEGFPTGATDKEIDALAEAIGIDVPQDLRMWLKICNASAIGPGGMFGIAAGDTFLDIAARMSRKPLWRSNGWIPIAGDGVGSAYIMICCNSIPGCEFPIAFSDHEYEFNATYLVASSIWHFIKFLFERDLKISNNWPFSKDRVLRIDPDLQNCKQAPLAWDVADQIHERLF